MSITRNTVQLVAVLSLVSATASAQRASDSLATPAWSTGAVTLEVGTDRLGIGALNRMMTANGRPTFGTDIATIGLSGHARFGRFAVGGTGETALPQRTEFAGWTNRLWYGSASMDIGYALLETRHLHIRPQLSAGIRHRVLAFENGGAFTYDGAIENPARSVRMSSWHALAGAGVVAEWRAHTRATGDFSLGVRGGYSSPVGDGHTRAGAHAVTGAPGDASGAYVRVGIGKPIGKRRTATSLLSSVLVPLVVR